MFKRGEVVDIARLYEELRQLRGQVHLMEIQRTTDRVFLSKYMTGNAGINKRVESIEEGLKEAGFHKVEGGYVEPKWVRPGGCSEKS